MIFNLGVGLAAALTGALKTATSTAGKLGGAAQTVSRGIGGVKDLMTTIRGRVDLNDYSGNVRGDMEGTFNQLASGSQEFNEEMMMRATNPADSVLGKSMIRQGETAVNRALATSLVSGQANSYDVGALQQRATEQGTGAITNQLSAIAKDASDRYLQTKQFSGGVSPSTIVPVFQGSASYGALNK